MIARSLSIFVTSSNRKSVPGERGILWRIKSRRRVCSSVLSSSHHCPLRLTECFKYRLSLERHPSEKRFLKIGTFADWAPMPVPSDSTTSGLLFDAQINLLSLTARVAGSLWPRPPSWNVPSQGIVTDGKNLRRQLGSYSATRLNSHGSCCSSETPSFISNVAVKRRPETYVCQMKGSLKARSRRRWW